MQNPQGQLTGVLMRLLRIGLGLSGLTSLALGVWMLSSPANWFAVFPAALEDFGPFNAHFIRDLGGWYAAGGLLLMFALTNPMRFGGVALVVSLVAYVAHAGTHLADLVSGRVGAKHWLIDTPLVFLPVVMFVLLTWIWWTLQSGRHPEMSTLDGEEAVSAE